MRETASFCCHWDSRQRKSSQIFLYVYSAWQVKPVKVWRAKTFECQWWTRQRVCSERATAQPVGEVPPRRDTASRGRRSYNCSLEGNSKKKVKPKRVQLPRDGAGTSASGLESDDDLNGGFDNFQDWPSEEKPEPEQLVARPRKKSPWHSIQSVEQASRVFANLSESDEGGEEEEGGGGGGGGRR